MNLQEESTQTLFYFLPRIFVLLVLLFIGGVIGLFVFFALNGGAAGSSEMNQISTLFSIIYALIFLLIFLYEAKKLFPKRENTSKTISTPENKTVSSMEAENLSTVNTIYILQATALFFVLTMLIAVIMN